ncbi:MAG: tRNA (N6-threonylcarbamoyladenosine(37)-N6)-methyltransferase TrmO [Thermotaleaceae bacterium]
MNEEIIIRPIGRIETQFKTREELNIPPYKAEAPYNDPNITGIVHVFEEYIDGIKDIEPGSSAMLIFHFNKSDGYKLITESPNFEKPVGVFSTRSPNRPNGIGVSVVKFISIEGSKLTFQGVDMLDGTPLLDIKPFGNKIIHK